MTLNMISVGAFLSAVFFLGILVFLFCRYRYPKKSITQAVAVPLNVDRSALLAEQLRQVRLRRQQLKEVSVPARSKKEQTTTAASSVADTKASEPIEEGFGEDLGAALSLATKTDVIPKKSRSRFAALQDAADEFKEIYNRNNQL